jgi:hypothetical protein
LKISQPCGQKLRAGNAVFASCRNSDLPDADELQTLFGRALHFKAQFNRLTDALRYAV